MTQITGVKKSAFDAVKETADSALKTLSLAQFSALDISADPDETVYFVDGRAHRKTVGAVAGVFGSVKTDTRPVEVQSPPLTDAKGDKALEYFGATSVDYDETPINNIAAFNDAVDFCADVGGRVLLGSGIYGVDGPIVMRSYNNFLGLGPYQSFVKQLSATPSDTFTSPDGTVAGTSIAFCTLENFAIHGGWVPQWGADRATHTAAAIRLQGTFSGPDDPSAIARYGQNPISDPYHTVRKMFIYNVPGDGIRTGGRGEMQIRENRIWFTSLYGIYNGAPDNWFSNNSVNVTGDSAMKNASSNCRFENEKYWFAGRRTDQQGVCAGYESGDSGQDTNILMGVCTQDTWGPGIEVNGDALCGWVQIDEAGGGRLEKQGFGWQGTRTDVRSCIRIAGGAARADLKVQINGGNQNFAAKRPYLIDFYGAQSDNNTIQVNAEQAFFSSAGLIRTSDGYTNSKSHNHIDLNGKRVHGLVTEGNLLDASHRINSVGNYDTVQMTDGRFARRLPDNTWGIVAFDMTITPQ